LPNEFATFVNGVLIAALWEWKAKSEILPTSGQEWKVGAKRREEQG